MCNPSRLHSAHALNAAQQPHATAINPTPPQPNPTQPNPTQQPKPTQTNPNQPKPTQTPPHPNPNPNPNPKVLYERACEYLELETRVEVLNARFEVRTRLCASGPLRPRCARGCGGAAAGLSGRCPVRCAACCAALFPMLAAPCCVLRCATLSGRSQHPLALQTPLPFEPLSANAARP